MRSRKDAKEPKDVSEQIALLAWPPSKYDPICAFIVLGIVASPISPECFVLSCVVLIISSRHLLWLSSYRRL